ncbi:fibrinogen C domain-containing protein 1-like [Dreissena polymorpha]|nr:fibrinogen C domain-containing protein 1-like [Dreissena polymorpha]
MTHLNKETTELRHDLLREVKRMDDSKEKELKFKDASMQVKSLIERMGALMDNFTSHVTQYVSRVQSDMRTLQGVCKTRSTTNDVNPKPTSCDDVDKSGVHTIYPYFKPSGLAVYCEIDQDKACLVIQRRKFGTVDFDRSWEEYKTGFGNLSGGFLARERVYLPSY